MRARRCILIAIFTYTGARVTRRNDKRDLLSNVERRESSSGEIRLTLARLRGPVPQISLLWKRKQIIKLQRFEKGMVAGI